MSSVPPPQLTSVAQKVEQCLDAAIRTHEVRWLSLDEDLALPVQEIRRLTLSGGKRLRPAFAYWAFVALGGDPADHRIIEVGSAIELLHGFALFHDDIMDGADSRRGVPTTHVTLAQRHESERWAGESRRFGEGAAILIGDLAFVMADELFGEVSKDVRRVWNELRLELNIGQYLDMLGSARHERRREVADRICRYKSGKYTVERPLHIGALMAHPTDVAETVKMFSRIGLPLGDAFQMRDDVLGVFGDSMITGKPVGNDLREGKPTPLLARAFEMANAAQKEILSTVGHGELSADDVARIQTVIVECGALADMETLIDDLRHESVEAITESIPAGEARDALTALAMYVTARTT